MNVSRSAASVASTATTSKPESPSPKKKKIFTVARPIPSPLDNVPAISDAPASDEVKVALKKQLRRDNNGKIMMHSALGTPEDIEHLSDFLSAPHQGTKDRARTLKRNGSSAQNVFLTKSSSSTRSLLGNETSRSKVSSLEPSSSRSLLSNNKMQIENAEETASKVKMDVKRQQLTEYKKKLRQMPIHERISMDREKNVLMIWEKRNREWEQFKAKISKKLNKPETDLVMSKAADYRQQIEEYDIIHKATPQVEKHGTDYWTVSLRDEGTRFVPVGNIFSGLFCPIKEDKSPYTESIRRPFDVHKHTSKVNHSNPYTDALAARKRQLYKNIRQIRPHVVDNNHCEGLKIVSQDLMEWAKQSSQHYYDAVLNLERSQTSSIASIRQDITPPSSAQLNRNGRRISISQKSSRSGSVSRIEGPCIQFIDIASGGVFLDELQLSFHTRINVVQTIDVLIANPSSTLLQFQWTQHGPSHRDFAPKAAGISPRTFISQTSGCLLPNETKTIRFSFKSATPGIFLEKWKITIDPYMADNNTIVYASEHTIHLTCTAVDCRAPVSIRANIVQNFNDRSIPRMIESLLRSIIKDIEFPDHVLVDEAAEAMRIQFEKINGRHGVHYSPELCQSMQTLFDHAQNLVLADQQAQLIKPTSGDSPVVIDSHAEDKLVTWNLSFESLMEITKQADTVSEAAAVAKAAEEAAKRAANNDEDDEDEDEDEENNKSKVVFRPIFQMACHELILLSQLRPHDSSFLLEQLSRNFSFLCSEIPLVSAILKHELSNDEFYTELYRQGRAFMAQAFDTSFTALYGHETNLSIADLKRDKLWIPSIKTMDHFPPPAQEDSSVLLYVDLDVAHCFTVKALEGLEANAGEAAPIPTEWNWIDGIDTFTPKKILKAAQLVQDLHQVHKQAYTGEKDVTVTVVLLSHMSKPRVIKDKSKKKKKQPALPLPEDAMPSMVYVSQKLQETLGLPVEFIPCLDLLHERLDKPITIPTPSPIHGDQPGTSTEDGVKAPSFDFRVLLMEHWDQLLHPKPRVEQVVVEEVKVVKDDPKAKPSKKKGKEKEEEDKKPSTPAVAVEKKELPHYDTLEAKLDAVWHNSYCDVISDCFDMFIDVVVLDTFGADDWQTIVAIAPKKTRVVGPTLAAELHRLKPIVQPQDLWSYRVRPNGSRLAALVGGKSLISKVWVLDNLLEIADDIYLTGSVACTFLRYLNLPKAQRKQYDQDSERGLTFRVMERLQSKAQRLLVKIYLPMDFIVGDSPIVPEDDEKPADGEQNSSSPTAEEEDEDDDDGEDDDEDDEEEEPVPKKKKKKVVKVVETVIVTEPEELFEVCISTPYEGTTFIVQHRKLSSQSAWIAIDEIAPGALHEEYQVANQPGNSIPLPHHWINRVYDIGSNALDHLTKRISVQGDPVIIAGVPGITECRDFQTSTKGIIAALQSKEDVVIVGGTTTKWFQHLEEGAPCKIVRSHLNTNVLKYLVAGKKHPALSSIMH